LLLLLPPGRVVVDRRPLFLAGDSLTRRLKLGIKLGSVVDGGCSGGNGAAVRLQRGQYLHGGKGKGALVFIVID